MDRIKRSFVLTVILLVLSAAVLAETPPPKGATPWEDRYKEDSVLCFLNETEIEVNADGTSSAHYHMIYKIQKEAGKELGEIPVSYDASYQEIKDLSAFITTPQGKKLKYSKIQELSEHSGYAIYSNEKTKIITLPEVTIGSVLEREVTIVDNKAQIDGNYFDMFWLSSSSPVKLLRYTVSFPRSMPVNIYSFNTEIHPVKETRGDRVVYTWESKDQEQGSSEKFTPPDEEIDPWVIITTLKDWKAVSDWYRGLVDKNLAINDRIKMQVAELTKDKPSQKDKAEAIVKYMLENFRYVAMNFGANRYEPHPACEVFENKYGDCKDQVTLVLAMLKEAGITAWPALYLDEPDGIIYDEAPSPQYFDHVILVLEADGRTYYVDPLVDGYHIGEIPYYEQGANLFVVTDKGGYRTKVPIQDNDLMTSMIEGVYNIMPNGSAVYEETNTHDREDSIEDTQLFGTMNEDDKKEFHKLFESTSGGGKLLDYSHSDTKDKYSPFVFKSRQALPNFATVQGRFMLITPNYSAPNLNFVTTERTSPVVFYSSATNKAKIVYNLPAGYKVEALPEDANISTKLFDFTVKYKVEGAAITEESNMKYKRGRVELGEYPALKSAYDMVKRYLTKIIIVSKGK